ncbi:unnamed protein product [Paramecium octaurelia]|uniref:Transmembrane protein n=1 Tax=Paramecium octaurelia TaxID=43137 RepID=A0A8S1TJL1_PAROT|nr:unnamed protein product [Paramecium octaurelia]
MILIFGNHNIINIFNQVSNNKNAIKIPFYSDNSRIFQSISKQNFVIVNNQTIIGYQYQDYLREIWVFKVSQKIYDILQIGDNLGIQQEECKEIKIDLGNMTFLQMNQSLQKSCTFTINNGLFITILKDKITIKGSTTNKLSYTFNNLLQHIYFVDINCLIIFELQGALIIAKLYNIQSQKLYFLYNLPLYDFEIVEPISYKVAQTYLAIKVKNKENQFFVMVYNIKYFATNCLIKVIEIDPDFNEFNYIGHSQIFVQFNKQIIVHFLQWVLLNLTNLQFDSNTYYNKSFVELQKKSDLFLQTQSIIIELVAINTNQQLQIINSSIPVYYSIRQQNKEIFLDNIFGSIDFLLYHNSNGSEIKLNPLLIAGQLSCLQPFQNQVCISQNDQIILNYFDKQNKLIFHLPEITLSQYQFLRKLNNNYELFLIFSNQSGCSYLINQNGQILTNKTLDVRHLFPNQPPPDLIFSVIGNLGILKSNNQPLLVFKILENALSQFYQFGESYESQTSLVKILYVNNNYIIFHSSKIQKETFSVSILNDQFDIIKKIQVDIKHLIPENDIKIVSSLVFIEIIEYFFKDFIIDADLILCYEFLFCQRMDFQINFNNKKYTFETTSIIRYPYREYFIKQVVLISKTQFIIQFQNQHKTAYFYNLNNKSAFIVDSFYKETKDVQLEFYDYDQYIEIRQVENYVELTLMNIKPYTIKCSQQCSQSQEYIQLLNQVSNLQIVLFPKIKEKEKIPFQFSLVILNFITVLTYTHFKRNRKNISNQICK